MTFQATEGACAFAWRNYLLLHSGISEDDHRRSALNRYLTDLGDAGDFDFDLLQIAAVSYLKSLDELHDEEVRDLPQIRLWRSVPIHARPTTAAARFRPVSDCNDSQSNRPARRNTISRISPSVIFCARSTNCRPRLGSWPATSDS